MNVTPEHKERHEIHGCVNKKSLVFILLAIIFLAVRIILIQQPMDSDDIFYFQSGDLLLSDRHLIYEDQLPADVFHAVLRLGFTVPIAFTIKLLGYNIFSYYTLPLIFSLAGFIIMMRILNETLPFLVVVMTSLLHIVYPFETRHSSVLLTDLPSAFLSLAYLYYVYKNGSDESDMKKMILHSCIASLLLFWIYMTRVNQIVLLSPAICMLLFYRSYRKFILSSIFILFLLILAEQLFYMTKGVQFGFRWYMVKAGLDRWAPYYPSYTLGSFLMRSFDFVLRNLGIVSLLFFIAALPSHIYGLIASKNPLVRAVLISGLVTFLAFNYNVYEVSDGKIKALNVGHRYMQLFYYSSLVAIPFSLFHIFPLLKKKISNITSGSSKLPLKYPGAFIIAVVFLSFLIEFSGRSFFPVTRLLNPENEYMSLLLTLKKEMKANNHNRIQINGVYSHLVTIRLFPSLERNKHVDWQTNSHADLMSKLEKLEPDYVLRNTKAEKREIAYFKRKGDVFNEKMIGDISDLLYEHYILLHKGRRLLLFKKEKAVKSLTSFPNMSFHDFDIEKQEIPSWRFRKNDYLSLSKTEDGLLQFTSDIPPGERMYVISGVAKTKIIPSPPLNRSDYMITPGTEYFFDLDTEIKGENINVSLWLMEYNDKKRVKSSKFNLTNGRNFLSFITGGDSKYFRVALRFAGSGTFVLRDFKIFTRLPNEG